LSRLNRHHKDKDDTFVLDFANSTDDIATAFEPYYGRTMAIPTDPNEMGDARRELADFGIIWADEIGPVLKALRSDMSKAQAKAASTSLRRSNSRICVPRSTMKMRTSPSLRATPSTSSSVQELSPRLRRRRSPRSSVRSTTNSAGH